MVPVVLLTGLLALAFYFATRKPKNFPPGPRCLPVVGNLFHAKPPVYEWYIEQCKVYGDVLGLYFGSIPVVILNNYKDVRAVLSQQVSAGRHLSDFWLERNLGGNRGLLFAEGKVWSSNRRFTLKTLRDFGFGKKSMEGLVMEEINELIATLRKDVGHPIKMLHRFNIASLNALWTILTGDRFDHDDPMLARIIKNLTESILHQEDLAQFFPVLYRIRKLLPFLFPTTALEKFNIDTYALIQRVIEKHEQTFQGDSSRDFVDVFLKEIRDTSDPSSNFHGKEGELNLRVVLLDLFAGGADTTSSTLTWTFLLLAHFSDVQERLCEEIRNVVGSSRHVSLNDRPDMPYLEATIHEILRFSSLTPLGAPHKALEDITLHGYTIPKGSLIFGNIYKASREESVWGDPEAFRPERFLHSDGKTLLRFDAWIPFGTGRRVCPGESLARDQLFLFIGNLFQAFRVERIPGEPFPPLEFAGGVLVPKAHQLILREQSGN